MRKSDLDMVQLVEHLSNPMSKCIPQCMHVRLQAGADCSMIGTELKKQAILEHIIIFYFSKWGPLTGMGLSALKGGRGQGADCNFMFWIKTADRKGERECRGWG